MSEKPSVEEIRARRADPVDAPSAIEMLYTEIDALRAELFAAQKKCKAAEEIIAEVIGDDQFDGLEDGIVAAIYFLRGDRDELDAQLASEREAKEQAERKLERYTGRRFPLLDGPSIPWSVIAPFEGQARRNHGQTLERLKERGGLSIPEAIHIMECIEWHRSPRSAAIRAMSARDAALHLQALIDSAISSPSRAPSTEEPERESPDQRGAKGHWPDVGARAMTSAEYGESPSMSPSLESQTPENTTNG